MCRRIRGVCVRPDLHAPELVGPAQQRVQRIGRHGRLHRQQRVVHLARCSVDRDSVARAQRARPDVHQTCVDIADDVGGAGDGRRSGPASGDRRVRRGATVAGEHACGGDNGSEVLRRRLSFHQDHRAAGRGGGDRRLVVEHDLSGGSARRRSAADDQRLPVDAGSESSMEHLFERIRVDPQHRLLTADHAGLGLVDRDPHSRAPGTTTWACFEQPEPASLADEVDAHHLPGVALEVAEQVLQLPAGCDIQPVQLGERSVDGLIRRVWAPDLEGSCGRRVTGHRVAAEGHAGSGCAAGRSEDHQVDDHRGTDVVAHAVVPPEPPRRGTIPRGEHGLDTFAELPLEIRGQGSL